MIFTAWWQVFGLLLFIIAITYCIIKVMSSSVSEVVITIRHKSEEEVAFEKLESMERYYNHFNVVERYGLTFKQFSSKVENGTWEEAVNNGPLYDKPYNGPPKKL